MKGKRSVMKMAQAAANRLAGSRHERRKLKAIEFKAIAKKAIEDSKK